MIKFSIKIILFYFFYISSSHAIFFKAINYFNCSGQVNDKIEGKKINWEGMRYIGLEKDKIYFWWNGNNFLQEQSLNNGVSKLNNENILISNFFSYGANKHIIKFHISKNNSNRKTLISYYNKENDTPEGYENIAFLVCKQIRKNQLR
jgi:hypothetical protein